MIEVLKEEVLQDTILNYPNNRIVNLSIRRFI